MTIEETTYSKSKKVMLCRNTTYDVGGDIRSAVERETKRAEIVNRTIAVMSMNNTFAVLIENYGDYYSLIVFSNTERKGDEQ